MRILFLCIVAATALVVLEASAQSSSSGSFLARLGKDTVAVEQYALNAHELSGSSIARNPQTTIRQYSAAFGPNGTFERFHVSFQPFGKPVSVERDYVYNEDGWAVEMNPRDIWPNSGEQMVPVPEVHKQADYQPHQEDNPVSTAQFVV